MAKRKLIIEEPTGRRLYLSPDIDLSDLPNADARAPLMAVVSEECGTCGHWHEVGRVALPNWSDGNYKAYYARMANYRDNFCHCRVTGRTEPCGLPVLPDDPLYSGAGSAHA